MTGGNSNGERWRVYMTGLSMGDVYRGSFDDLLNTKMMRIDATLNNLNQLPLDPRPVTLKSPTRSTPKHDETPPPHVPSDRELELYHKFRIFTAWKHTAQRLATQKIKNQQIAIIHHQNTLAVKTLKTLAILVNTRRARDAACENKIMESNKKKIQTHFQEWYRCAAEKQTQRINEEKAIKHHIRNVKNKIFTLLKRRTAILVKGRIGAEERFLAVQRELKKETFVLFRKFLEYRRTRNATKRKGDEFRQELEQRRMQKIFTCMHDLYLRLQRERQAEFVADAHRCIRLLHKALAQWKHHTLQARRIYEATVALLARRRDRAFRELAVRLIIRKRRREEIAEAQHHLARRSAKICIKKMHDHAMKRQNLRESAYVLAVSSDLRRARLVFSAWRDLAAREGHLRHMSDLFQLKSAKRSLHTVFSAWKRLPPIQRLERWKFATLSAIHQHRITSQYFYLWRQAYIESIQRRQFLQEFSEKALDALETINIAVQRSNCRSVFDTLRDAVIVDRWRDETTEYMTKMYQKSRLYLCFHALASSMWETKHARHKMNDILLPACELFTERRRDRTIKNIFLQWRILTRNKIEQRSQQKNSIIPQQIDFIPIESRNLVQIANETANPRARGIYSEGWNLKRAFENRPSHLFQKQEEEEMVDLFAAKSIEDSNDLRFDHTFGGVERQSLVFNTAAALVAGDRNLAESRLNFVEQRRSVLQWPIVPDKQENVAASRLFLTKQDGSSDEGGDSGEDESAAGAAAAMLSRVGLEGYNSVAWNH